MRTNILVFDGGADRITAERRDTRAWLSVSATWTHEYIVSIMRSSAFAARVSYPPQPAAILAVRMMMVSYPAERVDIRRRAAATEAGV